MKIIMIIGIAGFVVTWFLALWDLLSAWKDPSSFLFRNSPVLCKLSLDTTLTREQLFASDFSQISSYIFEIDRRSGSLFFRRKNALWTWPKNKFESLWRGMLNGTITAGDSGTGIIIHAQGRIPFVFLIGPVFIVMAFLGLTSVGHVLPLAIFPLGFFLITFVSRLGLEKRHFKVFCQGLIKLFEQNSSMTNQSGEPGATPE